VDVDAWSVDAAVGGLQKCLGGPPGLAPLTLSDRAAQTLSGRTAAPDSAYLDLSRAATAWRDGAGRAGMSTHMLLAAREALRIVVDEGLQTRWERHRRASRALRAGLEAMGLALFGERAHGVPMISLVQVPDGVDEASVRDLLLRDHAIEIMAAFGPLRGRVWRIGTMGTNARLASVLAVLSGLETVLAGCGFRLPRGAGADAALAAYRVNAL